MYDNKINITKEKNEIKNNEQNQINILFEKQKISIKNDIIFFKDDILKELKNLKLDLHSKYNHLDNYLEEKIKDITLKNSELNEKIEFISKTIDSKISNSSYNEKNTSNYTQITTEIKKELKSNGMKIENLKDEFKRHKEQYDNLIKDNIFYNGIIGSGCQYTNMHQFIDYIILNINNLNNFKNKKNVDNKMYEHKILNMLDNLNNQANNTIENCKVYTNQHLKILEEKIKSNFKLYDSKFIELRIENLNYSKKIELKLKELDEIYNKIISIKKDINENYDKTSILIDNYQKEFKSIKENFNTLSDFFKDLKLKKNFPNIYTKKDNYNVRNKLGFENIDQKIKRTESAIIKYSSGKENYGDYNNKDDRSSSENNNNYEDFKKSSKEIIKNINFELRGVNKKKNLNFNKTISNNSIKRDEKNSNNDNLSIKYEFINFNENSQKNRYQMRKILKNEKLEKYNFLYGNRTNDNPNKQIYLDLFVKSNNHINNNKIANFKYIIKKRNPSALHGEKFFLLNINKNIKNNNEYPNKNEIKNLTSKELYENGLLAFEIDNCENGEHNYIYNIKKNSILKNIKNYYNLENNNSFILLRNINNEYSIIQSYTNRNKIEQEMNHILKKVMNNNTTSKSMENIIRRNNEGLFYKNLSSNKIKIKNLVCIK